MNKVEKTAENMKKTGKKMEKLGCLLTLVITIPIILTVIMGPWGTAIGVIIAILAVVGAVKGNKENKT